MLNNNLMLEGYMWYEHSNMRITGRILREKKTPYDAITSCLFKCNLFLFKKVSECNDSENDNDPLFEELDAFFSKNKNVNGYFQFLRGAIIKFSRQGNREKEIIYLNKVIDYVREINIGTLSIENFIAIQARIKLAEYSNNFFEIDKYINLIWKERIIPLLKLICNREYEDELLMLTMLSNSYMGLIMSVCKYYIRLNDQILYKYVVNYKYILEKVQKNDSKITWSEIDNLNSIKFSKDYLVVDSFQYRYIDFGNPLYIVSMDGIDLNDIIHKVFWIIKVL